MWRVYSINFWVELYWSSKSWWLLIFNTLVDLKTNLKVTSVFSSKNFKSSYRLEWNFRNYYLRISRPYDKHDEKLMNHHLGQLMKLSYQRNWRQVIFMHWCWRHLHKHSYWTLIRKMLIFRASDWWWGLKKA